MHRFEEVASENFASYRDALIEAYGEEIENVEDAFWWFKVRVRAARRARRQRREKKHKAKAGALTAKPANKEPVETPEKTA